ncbi:MAG: glycoside hydrolase family 97 catalytic domain-containing protein [Lentisphaeria bacterium]|nr:glycoside hydrolase family 97 catalytic domain-containing protein [Lentisphaeria bacterium]
MKSPSETVRAEILSKGGQLVYSVQFNDQTIINEAAMGIVVDGVDYSKSQIEPDHVKTETVDQTYPIPGVKSTARNHYTGTTVPLTTIGVNGKWALEMRAYDDGFAFRYVLLGKGRRTIQNETTSFNLPDRSKIWYFERNNAWKLKSYAGEWISAPISRMPRISKMGPIQGLPLVVELPNGGYAVLTEAACWNYSGMRCKAVGNNTFVAALADPSFELHDGIVTPWRVVLCAENLNAMVNSTLVSNLAPEPDSTLYSDTGYIKPGRSVWRWWSSGTGSPEQEKDYIDYAVALGYEYTTIDDGWKDWPDAWNKLAELCEYAQEKKIGAFVWKHSKEINDPAGDWEKMRTFFDKVKAAGAVGMKIDFMNSESKATIDFEIAALKLAAQRKLLINFHGCHKSTGEARSYPNEITREGIRGLELNKMKEGPISASHNAALPFTRFIVGHADYTPFTVTTEKLGPTTISHQLATVVCFTTPLQTIAENPTVLFDPKFSDLVSVLKQIPSVWDETRVLPGSKIGDLAVMARRKGDVWFIAALNGAGRRSYALDLSFVDDRKYTVAIIRDHADSPAQFKAEEQPANRLTTMKFDMNEGGGFVALLRPEN